MNNKKESTQQIHPKSYTDPLTGWAAAFFGLGQYMYFSGMEPPGDIDVTYEGNIILCYGSSRFKMIRMKEQETEVE